MNPSSIIPEFKQINANEDFYKQMFQLSLLPILIHDTDMNILEANNKAVEEFGYTKEELMQKKVVDLHVKSELKHSEKVLKKLEKTNRLRVETRFKRKDGSVFYAEATPCKYIVNDKAIIYVYIQNIDQRKEYEIRMLKAMNKAEESDRLKSEFLANMSHELRTPLNAIMGFSSFLKDKNQTMDTVAKYADIIFNSGEHLLTLINDIIDISLIEAGKIKIAKTNFELNGLFITLYNFFHSYLVSIKKFSVVLKLSIPDTETFIITDETRLRQVLTNLISNAVKFTEKGVVEFGYNIEGRNIKFFVKDTGRGVPEDKKQIIFDRFTKAADTKEKLYGGTGLGLSIAKACTDILGGNIWFESETNIGSTFFVEIKHKRGTNNKANVDVTENPTYQFNNELILVAEDDDFNFTFLEKLILENNLKLIRSVTGRQTIEKALEHNDISLILMDIKMPDLSGIEATIEIKKQKPGIPIIAQTAFAYEKDKEEILNAGCIDYLCKPIDKNQLLRLIDKNITRKSVEN